MNPSALKPSVLVAGLGNPLMADDGFGSAVVDGLRTLGFPPGMSAETIPDVLHLRSAWRGEREIWMVDAVALPDSPGTIHRFDHDSLLKLAGSAGSAHHLELGVCLRWLLHANRDMASVRIRLWGVVPASVSARPELTQPVRKAAVAVAREIHSLANSWTVPVRLAAQGPEF